MRLPIYVLTSLVMCFYFSVAQAEEWDPFSKMEQSANGTINQDQEEQPAEQWPDQKVIWQEDKNQYTITIDLERQDPKDISIVVKDQTIVLSHKTESVTKENAGSDLVKSVKEETTQENSTKVLRVPEDGDLSVIRHQYIEGNLEIIIPKKKLKSIV